MTDSPRILRRILRDGFQADLSLLLLGKTFPSDIVNSQTGEIVWPAKRKITKICINNLVKSLPHIEGVQSNPVDPAVGPRLLEIVAYYRRRFLETKSEAIPKSDGIKGLSSGLK